MQIKLTAILLTLFMCHLSAKTVSQTVTISGTNLRLEHVLSAIEKQTGYTALYNEADLKKSAPITFTVRDLALKDFLDAVFNQQPLDYTIRRTTIFIRPKAAVPEKKVEEEAPAIELPPLKGRVTDSTGKGLPGVSITIMRGNNPMGIALTDATGAYAIAIELEKGDRLYFTYVGFESRMIAVDDRNPVLNVTLRPVVTDLAAFEVSSVNTGYQRIRPEHSTGAVAKITTKEYESRVSTDFLAGLVNRLPGLMINNDIAFNVDVNGVRSSNNLFNIRGISTMTGNQSPLIVVDGYPTELSLNMINPNEIESVTILRDAAAATVYGVRASNGVIVVERKQAAAGKARFNFRHTTGIRPKEDYTRYRWDDNASSILIDISKQKFGGNLTEATWSNLHQPLSLQFNPVYMIMAQEKAGVITPYQAEMKYRELADYDNSKEYGDVFLRSAVTQSYNLDISGGNKGALYYITANYTGSRQGEINNRNGRFLLTGRSTINLSNRLSLELTTDYLEENARTAPVPGINSLYNYERLRDASGAPLPVNSGSGINPFQNEVIKSMGLQDHMYYPLIDVYEENDRSKMASNRITANFVYKLGYGFNLRFGGIYENSRSELRHYASENASEAIHYVNNYVQQNPTTGALIYNIPKGGYLRHETSSSSTFTARAQLNYDKQLNKDHSINGILGAEVRDVVEQASMASFFGYNDETLLQQPSNFANIITGFRSPFFNSSYSPEYNTLFDQRYQRDRFVSGYSNIVYSFRSKYSLTGSIRIDQSNLFGSDPKYRYKPLWSLGAAWNLHKENFMQNVSWVNEWKIRVSDGFNGNVAKMSLPQVIARSENNTWTTPFSNSLIRVALANSSLRWEQTHNTNLGMDFKVFKNVRGTFDYYVKKSTDLVANAQIDPTIAPGPTLINTASINNKGIEITLNADWIAKPRFNWNTGLILGRNTSKVLKVYQTLTFTPTNLNNKGYIEGYPVGSMFAFKWGGLNASGFPQLLTNTGKPVRSDTTRFDNLIADRSLGMVQHMGTSIPVYNAGLSNRVDVGNFYFFCMINYYGGFKVMAPRANPNATRPMEGAGNYWKQPGDEQHTDMMSLAAFAQTYSNLAYEYADIQVVNGDYITLGDLTASWNLANYPAFRKAGFSLFEVKLQASNLYTIGLNRFNYSLATGNFAKRYITPNYTIALFTNF